MPIVCRSNTVMASAIQAGSPFPGRVGEVAVTVAGSMGGSPASSGRGNSSTAKNSSGNTAPLATEDKFTPMYIVKFGGINIADDGHSMLLKSIDIREACGQMSMMKLVFSNPVDALTDDALWDGQPTVEVWTGFAGTTLEKRAGAFQLSQPKFSFLSNGTAIVELVGFDESYLLGRSQKRMKYANMTDSQIAKQIAVDNGFTADVDLTTFVHESVIQANESDMQFLWKRAKLHGFEVAVKDGILHFHAPRYAHSGVVLIRRGGESSNLKSFSASVKEWYGALQVIGTQIDPITKKRINITSSDAADVVSKQGMSRTQGNLGIRKWDEIVNEVPQLYMLETGHEQRSELLQKEADGWAINTRFLIEGRAKTFGMEKIHGGQIVTILNVGKFSGDYLVTEARHTFNSQAAYQIDLEVRRSWLENPAPVPSVENVFSLGSAASSERTLTEVKVTATATV